MRYLRNSEGVNPRVKPSTTLPSYRGKFSNEIYYFPEHVVFLNEAPWQDLKSTIVKRNGLEFHEILVRFG